MKIFLLTFALFVSALFSPQGYAADPFAFLAPYDGLLRLHVAPMRIAGVDTTGVDYKSWAKDTRYPAAMAALQAANPALLSNKEQQLVFWINAYNLLTIHLIIEQGEQESIRNLGTLWQNVWKRYRFTIGNQVYTLHEIEHEILRPLGEPRIHFAINCASLSCPDLLDEVYRIEVLNEQLEQQTRVFLNNPTKGVRQQGEGFERQTAISKIFRWFETDFDDGNLRAYLRRYIELKSDKPFYWLDYNWQLNALPGRAPEAP